MAGWEAGDGQLGVGALLRLPGVPVMLAASVAARLPVSMTNLAVLLALDKSGSVSWAAAVSATFAAAYAVTAQLKGRSADARGQARLIAVCSVLCAAALAMLSVPALPAAALLLLAAVGGVAFPPVGAATRAVWSREFKGHPVLATAFTVDAVTSELAVVVGPLLVSVAAAVAGGRAAVLVTSVLVLAGGLSFAATGPVRRWRGSGQPARGLGPLAVAPIRLIASSMLLTSAALGGLTVAVVALAREHGRADQAGLLLSAAAVGSVLGGLISSRMRGARDRLAVRYAGLLAAFGLGLAPLMAVRALPAAAAVLTVAFLAAAPTYVVVSELLDAHSPPNVVTEAFTLTPTANWAGQGVGTAAAGLLLAHAAVGVALALPTILLGAAALVAITHRVDLAPPKGAD